MPLRGDVEWRWAYLPARESDVPNYPSGYEVTLGGDVLRRVTYSNITPGAAPDLLSLAGVQLPPAPTEPSPPPQTSFRELASGVWLARHVRPGFHHLVVEQDDGLVVVDAPAGWLEMTLVPPMEWVEGASSSSISRAFVEALRAQFPEKPVTHLVLTHWHSDHAGGVHAFAAAGATIVAAAPTRAVMEAALAASHSSEATRALRFVEPGDELVLGAGANAVRIIPVDNNPHAAGMLAAHVPSQRLIYLADLFEVGSQETFPSGRHRETMLWLIGWLDAEGLGDATILNAHGGPSEAWMLRRLRDTNARR